MELSRRLSIIGKLINDDRNSEAEELLDSVELRDNPEPMLLLYRALTTYERRDDLSCLKLLNEFVNHAPNHSKAPFAKYTAAICLINLGLGERAISILKSIPEDYPDLQKELKSAQEAIRKKREALSILTGAMKFPSESLEDSD